MGNKEQSARPDAEQHPLVQALIASLSEDKSGILQLSEDAYIHLHAALDQLVQANELALLAESLLNIAVNLDQERNSEAAATHVGLLAKAAADKAISINSDMTNTLDRIAKNAAQYQKFIAKPQAFPPKTGPFAKSEGVFKVGDLDKKKRKI